MVSMSASICVGCHRSVKPFQTGTPAYRARSSTSWWANPRNSIPSYIRPSTRAVSLARSPSSELRLPGAEVADVSALVMRGYFERRAGPGRRLLEDQGDVAAHEALGLTSGPASRHAMWSARSSRY